jgi:hypothetical protein
MDGMKLKIALALIIIGAFATAAQAQNVGGAGVVFDPRSPRLDLRTGKPVPAYTQAQQGSFRFFVGRLDKPDDFVYYFFDALRSVKVDDLARMEKDQAQFAIWNLVWKNGEGLHPPVGTRIQHLAVSFVPLTSDGKPGERVYLLLNDLKRIEWAQVKG